jgi:hypothetical protein
MTVKTLLPVGVLGVLLAAAVPADGGDKGVQIKATPEHIDFLIGDELVGRYHIGPKVAKPYFWPLTAPGGVIVTRAWPMEAAAKGDSTDHPHQKSAWFCHGDVIPEGIELKQKIKGVDGVDFWSEAKGHGKIVCTKVGAGVANDQHGSISTHNEWRTADGVKILDEVRTLKLYNFGKSRLLVLEIDLHASVCPITFGDTKEGAMGVRVHDALRTQGGKGQLVNAAGKNGEKEVWGQRSAWCDYSGDLGGKTAGIAVFDDPKNGFAAAWHSRGYGLMAANPFGREKSKFPAVKGSKDLVRLAKGEHLRLRYGILLHSGDAQAGNVAQAFERFVQLRGKE